MQSVLYGRIVHRFELPYRETNSRGKETSTSGHCGFIFIPESKSKADEEYLVSLPKRLLKPVCRAVRLGQNVAINRYKEISFLESSSTSNGMIEVFDLAILSPDVPEVVTKAKKRPRNDTSVCNNERAENLWTLTQFWRKEKLDFQKMKNARPKFSLVATVDAISPIVALDPSNPFALIEVYDRENTDVTCVVVLHGIQAMINHAAIHPLDTLIFRDVVYKPWAVNKVLYDERKKKGSNTATSYNQFLDRVPSHVFVATKADSICWDDESCTSSSEAGSIIPPIITPVGLVTFIKGTILDVQTRSVSSGNTKSSVIQYLDIILMNQSTVEIKKTNDGVDVNGENPTVESRCRLYLSHCPMSAALQCSLRKGGVIQASNIHRVYSKERDCFDNDIDNSIVTSYGACLRSTLVLLRHATDNTISLVEETTKQETKNHSMPSFETQSRELSHGSLTTKSPSTSHSGTFNSHGSKRIGSNASSNGHDIIEEYHPIHLPVNFLNYGFRAIRQTYLQDLYLEHVKRWEERGFRTSAARRGYRDDSVNDVPRKWLVDILLNSDWSNENKIHDHHAISKRVGQTASTRSPYAEFFDHSFCSSLNGDGIKMEDLSSSCHLTAEDRKHTSIRFSGLLDLNWIRIASQTYFENHIFGLLQSKATKNTTQLNQLRKGFQGSIRVPLSKLCNKNRKEDHNINDTTGCIKSNSIYLSGGFVSEIHTPISSVASIADEKCQIPITFNKTKCHANIDDFFIGQFNSVTISCLCVGNVTVDNEREIRDICSSDLKSVSLPSLSAKEKSLLGSCSLVTIGGFLFVTAIQIHCCDYQLLEMNKNSSTAQDDMKLNEVTMEVENCLATKDWLHESPTSNTVIGMLTRCEFYSKVNTNGAHKCCLLTVSSLKRSESKNIESDNSCLQAIELSVSVAQSTARTSKFNEIFSAGWPKVNLSGSQKALAISFWVLGGSARTCPITFGGSEDLVPGSSVSNSSIEVLFPSSSLQSNKLGYIRSLCSNDCLDAVLTIHESNDVTSNRNPPSFDFVCGMKTNAGTLHRRPARRTILRSDVPPLRVIGELSTICSDAIPLNTLSSLFDLIFQGLRNPATSQSIMNPSLVRRISNSRFLGVSFCKVECYCTRCFCSLTGAPSIAKSNVTGHRKRMRSNSFDEPSFWHLPHPEDSTIGANRTQSVESNVVNGSTDGLPNHIDSSKFRCPKNDCPKHAFDVRWECSGVLDDGTGQATLYADGDAALTLLGFSAKDIQTIEEGVWSARDGSIQFMKSIPPPKALRDKVIDILAGQRRENRKTAFMVDPLRLLSKQDRATYIFDRHCRSSSRPRRPLDYYVRCKPLVSKGNATPHLHHTTIDFFFEETTNSTNQSSTIHRGQTASYAIPSLKLELVDCGINSHDLLSSNFE